MRTTLKQLYNLRERLNIYAGVGGGLMAPVAFHRYFSFPLESKNLGEEVMKWLCAGVFSLTHIQANLFSLVLGSYLGFSGANELRAKRGYSEAVSERIRGEIECPRFGDDLFQEYLRR